MGKKGRNKKFASKEAEIERGYTVVFASGRRCGKRAYLASHPKGLPQADAEALSAGLLAETKVVPIDQVG